MATLKAKAKSGCQRTEVETTEEIGKLLEGFSEEFERGVVATWRPPEAWSHSIADLKRTHQAPLMEQTIAGYGSAGPGR